MLAPLIKGRPHKGQGDGSFIKTKCYQKEFPVKSAQDGTKGVI